MQSLAKVDLNGVEKALSHSAGKLSGLLDIHSSYIGSIESYSIVSGVAWEEREMKERGK